MEKDVYLKNKMKRNLNKQYQKGKKDHYYIPIRN